MGPLEDGAGSDAATRRVIDTLVDRVGGLRKDGHEWIELELALKEAR
jgi:hypothetical protein